MAGATYKELDLFGNEKLRFIDRQRKKRDLFTDHDAFVEKFEVKKTTDDCYTPPEVYETILQHVAQSYDLSGKSIIRPFYPGGDYEAVEYPDNAVVIDNPPFSIISKIVKFYTARGIPFFLFAPHLTLFSSASQNVTCVIVGGDITYENGAKVKTSFLTNMLGDIGVIGDVELHRKLEAINEAKKVNLPKYEYPLNVLTVSHVQWMLERGVSFVVNKKDAAFCRGLDDQKKHDKAIFGSGFLLSERAAAERAAAERAAAERAAAEQDNVIVWELSERELKIIKSLGK